ncbi:MAG: hypothetical protein WBE26_09600 [Phycisphaerae bacterium]
MKASVLKGFVSAAAVLVVVFGCSVVIDEPTDDSSSPQTESSQVDSDFSDAPVSPGGTGGTTVDDQGTDDVELPAEETRSFFTAFQIDPVAEDTAGPKFVVAADIDKDGLLDLVSAWNQSQPIQLHLQRRDPEGTISFRTITLAGTNPVAIVAGLEAGQINDDNGDGEIDDDDWLDVVILSKASGLVAWCPTSPPKKISNLDGEIIVLFSPGDAGLIPDGDRWTEMILVNPYVQDRWIHNQFPGKEHEDFEAGKTKPEWNGFTSLVVANIDGEPGDDIVVALNPGECEELGQKPPINTVDLWVNPGPGLAETSEEWGAPPPGNLSRGVPVALMINAPQAKDLAVMDIDDDGDLDVIVTWTNAITMNISWARNPLVPHQAGGPGGRDEVIAGYSSPGVDYCLGGVADGYTCPNGDIDCLGIPDGTCTGGTCVGGADDGADCDDNADCLGIEDGVCMPGSWRFLATGWEERPIGQVDTGADIIEIGDIDDDGSDDVLVRSTNGQIVQWFRQPNALVVAPEFPPNDPVPDRINFPWNVFTLTEFADQEPEAIAIGDVTGDGKVEVMVAVEGGVFWYDGTISETVYDPWAPNTIIQDSPADTTDATTAPGGTTTVPGTTPGTGVGVSVVDTSTHINTLLVVDLDGDGKNDIVGTLDRRTDAGLSDDRLVWYRNTRTEEGEE